MSRAHEAALREQKARASDLSRDLDASRREIKTWQDKAGRVDELEGEVADLKAELGEAKVQVAEANRARVSAELRLKAKPAAAVEEAELQYDRADLERALPDGWRLTHFSSGQGGRPEKYIAVQDAAGAVQRASTPQDLIRRIDSWENQRAAA